ncbi:MAG: peptide chain release factor-like protein [Pirellulales bacterium]|nr:peptide chain release factor-like protein [Pirellulales bacterium]
MSPEHVHPASLAPDALLAQCEMRRLRRSGPGGQHRNKVETAVQLLHIASGILAEANERRSQAANRSVALFRLRVNLALGVRGSAPIETHPGPLWRQRCGTRGQIAISAEHEDFPALLAEVLDVIGLSDDDLSRSAEVLGCTPSQLVKLLKKEPRALEQINRRRRELGLHAIH